MADPVTWAAIGTATTAASSLVGAIGSADSAHARAQSNQYQASVAALNARIALQNQEYASQKGEQDAQKYGLAAGQRAGGIKAAQGASGLDVNSGSAKQVQESQQLVTSMDLTQIRSNAAKVAYDYANESINQTNRAMMYLRGATDEERAGTIGAVSSILGGASSIASRWQQGQTLGIGGAS